MKYSIITIAISGFNDGELLNQKERIINTLKWSGLVRNDHILQLEFESKCHDIESDIETYLTAISQTLQEYIPLRSKELNISIVDSRVVHTRLIGDKKRFAIEVEDSSRGVRIMNIFVNGKSVCVDDNHIYVDGIIPHFELDISRLTTNVFTGNVDYFNGLTSAQAFNKLNDIFKIDIDDFSDEEYEKYSAITAISHQHGFLVWGPTTDNLNSYYYPLNGMMVLSAGFWRDEHTPKHELNEVYSIQIEPNEIKDILEDVLKVLKG